MLPMTNDVHGLESAVALPPTHLASTTSSSTGIHGADHGLHMVASAALAFVEATAWTEPWSPELSTLLGYPVDNGDGALDAVPTPDHESNNSDSRPQKLLK
jgi:hypothetical protein